MDIKDIKTARFDLEREITKIVKEFNEQTGVHVETINIIYSTNIAQYKNIAGVNVDLNIKALRIKVWNWCLHA